MHTRSRQPITTRIQSAWLPHPCPVALAFCSVQVNGSLLRSAQKPVDNLVARVKPAQLPDVLLLLVLQAVNEKPAAEAALALLQRDKEVLKVLHRGRNAGGSSSGSGQGGGADSSGGSSGGSQGNSSAPRWMVKWWKACNKTAQEKQRQQQQQQLTQQQAVKLVEEMLTVCVTYDLEDLCQAVAALPDAKHIGEGCDTHVAYVLLLILIFTWSLSCSLYPMGGDPPPPD